MVSTKVSECLNLEDLLHELENLRAIGNALFYCQTVEDIFQSCGFVKGKNIKSFQMCYESIRRSPEQKINNEEKVNISCVTKTSVI